MKRIALGLTLWAIMLPAKTRETAVTATEAAGPPKIEQSTRPAERRRGVRSWFHRLATLEPDLAMRLSGWGIDQPQPPRNNTPAK